MPLDEGKFAKVLEKAAWEEKYEGTMDFRVKDRVFILSVMMKNERRSEI